MIVLNKNKRDMMTLEQLQRDLLWEKRDKKNTYFETLDTMQLQCVVTLRK